MSKFTHLVAAAALAISVASVVATPAAAQNKGPNPYSDCGIGSALFPKVPVAAVLSNVIWDIGTTAVISAVSSPETCNGARYTAALYINETYARLEVEAAKGEGEYLTALASVMQCDAQAAPVLNRTLRASLSSTLSAPGFTELTHTQKAERLFNIVDTAATTELAGRCYVS